MRSYLCQTWVNFDTDLPEHAIAQGGAQCGGAKVTDVPPVEALFGESNADHHLVIVDVQQHLRSDLT